MHTKYRKIFGAALLMTLYLVLNAWPVLADEEKSLNDKVAVVNGIVITQEQFDRAISSMQSQSQRIGKPGKPKLSDVKKDVLEKLINLELLYHASISKEIIVDENAVNEQFAALKKRFPDEDKFKAWMSKMNISDATIKSQMKRDIAIQKFIEKEIVPKVTVNDKELKAYYDSHPTFFKQPETLRASHILIKVDEKANESQKAEAKKKLENIQERLKKGEDFATLAKEFSQCPSSAKGGDLGYFGRRKMVKPFEDAAFALEPGKVSDIVETKFGYHLIKLTEKKPENTMSYDEVKDRLRNYIKQNKIKTEIEKYIVKLKQEAKIERFLDK